MVNSVLVEKSESFQPDYATPPGWTIADSLEHVGMSQVEFAERMELTAKTVSEILNGKAPLSFDTACKLSRVVGSTPQFWCNLEFNYRYDLEKAKEKLLETEKADWTRRFPIRQMVDLGWINKHEHIHEIYQALLAFFGVSSKDAWGNLYGESAVFYRMAELYEPDTYALAAWLRQGERQAESLRCSPYDRAGFAARIPEMRSLTKLPPELFVPKLIEICRECGVAVAFVPELPKTGVSGATRWLSHHKALIQLSLRYKRDDALWFSFFHECAHLLRHNRSYYFSGSNKDDTSRDVETEANHFAAEILIPPKDYRRFLQETAHFTEIAIKRFADSQGISVGIVVGRLQHDKKIPWKSSLNSLKTTLTWKK
jgi:addiction module HigA family antidote